MSVAMILKEKVQETHTCRKEWLVLMCIHLMNEKKVGALVVTDEVGQIEGIVTERDIMRMVGKENCLPDEMTVEDIMTGKESLVVADKETTVEQVMELMTSKRIRHIPIVENGSLVGIISIGDAVKYMLDMMICENNSIKNYIYSTPM